MNLAVIIPSFNGSTKLPILLSSLRTQVNEDVEVIIVDDGSNPPIALPRGFEDVRVRVHRIANSGRAVARNVGASLTSAEIVLFCDDDIELCRGALERHMQFHATHSKSILTGNPIPPDYFRSGDPYRKYRWRVEMEWARPLAERGIYECTVDDFYITTQNLSMPKKLFDEHGGFDYRLKDSEDFDFGARAVKAGISLFVDGQLQIIHHEQADLSKTLRRQHEYYTWKIKLLELHPEYRHEFADHFKWLEKKKSDGLKRIIFHRRKWWERFLGSRIFQSLPDTIQSQLFSHYIYSNTVLNVKLHNGDVNS